MTKSDQPKPIQLPALLVYGKPTSPDIPQASWFRPEDRAAVLAAAQALKFSVIDIKSETERPLIDGVHEGVMKAGGRLIVASVTVEVYRRIEDHVRKSPEAVASPGGLTMATGAKSHPEQTTNTATADPAAAADGGTRTALEAKSGSASEGPAAIAQQGSTSRDPWDALRIGSHVLAKYWESDGEAYGWWVAVIKDIEKGGFVVRWLDEPLKPAFKTERKHLALLHPSFDVSREWDKRR